MVKNTGGVSFKTGVVVEAKAGFAKVQFAELDDLVSQWLPITFHKTSIDKSAWWLDIGEHVQCLLDDRLEDGCILGAIYSAPTPAPAISADETSLQFGNKVSFKINRATGDVEMTTTGIFTVTALKIRFQTALLEVTGEIKDLCDALGKTMQSMRQSYNAHGHADPQGGTTQPPNNAM